MPFVLDNESTIAMGLLGEVEDALDVTFTPQEFKIIRDYLRSNPNLSLAAILEEVYSIARNKLEQNKKMLADEDKQKIRKNWEKAQLFERIKQRQREAAPQKGIKLSKEKGKKLTDKEIKRIIDEAEKKLLDKKVLTKKTTSSQKRVAIEHFRQFIHEEDSPVDLAITALLGMVKGISGGIKAVLGHNWGNRGNVPDVYGGDSDAPIDQANNPDTSLVGDPMGSKVEVVIKAIRAGNFSGVQLINLAQRQDLNHTVGDNAHPSSPTITPMMTHIKDPTPFDD